MLCTFGFVDYVVFLYNRVYHIKNNKYVSSSCLGGDASRTSDSVVWLRSPGGRIVAKSAISNCILFRSYDDGGIEICPLPLLSPLTRATACTTVQANKLHECCHFICRLCDRILC